MRRLKAFWSGLTSEQKRKWVLSVLIVAVLALGTLGYKMTRGSATASAPVEAKKEISLEPKMLEKSLVMESQKELKSQKDSIDRMRQEIEELKKEKEERIAPAPPGKMDMAPPPPNSGFPRSPLPPPTDVRIPPPPPPPSGREASRNSEPKAPEQEVIGEISVVSNPYAKAEKAGEAGDTKKEKKTIYLPPSFMEATLLTGLDAETVESAKGNPEPVLLRIRDLAVLPNQIKTNLKGCFVIAHGYGKLSKERVELRLVTLSCLAKNGQAVIDQAIKGYVADEDGKNGLRGNVVSRMGAAVARAAIAGFFG